MNKTSLKDRVILITGSTRGIGHAIGLRAAQDGAKVVITGKSVEPHPKLPGTIYTAAEDMKNAGGEGLPIELDVRDESQVDRVVAEIKNKWGRLDILVNNASAIFLAPTEKTPMKRFDLIHQVNVRGTFLMSQKCVPLLKQSDNAHILNLSPPLNFTPENFAPHLAYSMSKFGMSLCVLGMAAEFKKDQIAVNALWPKSTIATAAIEHIVGGKEMMARSRKPTIMSDAAHTILTKDSREFSGNYLLDEDFLRSEGTEDFAAYAVDPTQALQEDFFIR